MSVDDDELFEKAMRRQGVRPVGAAETAAERRERESREFEAAMAELSGSVPEAAPASPPPVEPPPEPEPVDFSRGDALFEKAMARLDQGDAPIAEPTKAEQVRPPAGRERPSRHVGTPKSLRRLIRQGHIQADQELDLHGKTREQAWSLVHAAVRRAIDADHEVVRVICGRGLHSDAPVLRQALRGWTRRELRPLLTEAVTAPQSHGGEGVMYLFVRRFHDAD